MRIGNLLASRVVLLLYMVLSKAAKYLLEQPANSEAPNHPRVDAFFNAHWVFQGSMWGGAYAIGAQEELHASAKRHWLWSNDPEIIREIQQAASSLSRSDLDKLKQPLTARKRDASGNVVWTGLKDNMKQSQNLFCSCVAVSLMFLFAVGSSVVHHGIHLLPVAQDVPSEIWSAFGLHQTSNA